MGDREITFKEAIIEALAEEMEASPDIFLLGEDIVHKRRPVLQGLKEKYPDRVINNLPLIEDMIIGIALGMSDRGLFPVVNFNYDTHVALAIDDLLRVGIWRYRMAEREKRPGMIVRLAHDSLVSLGPEFSASLLSSILHIPEIWVATPSRPYIAKGLLKSAFRAGHPVVFWEHKRLYEKSGKVPIKDSDIPFGISSIFKEGTDVTILSWSFMSYVAKSAADILEKEKISAEVVSLQTLNPLDMVSILRSAKKTRRVLIVEEEMLRSGVGAEIAAELAEKFPGCTISRLGIPNIALPRPHRFEELVIPSEETIAHAAQEMMKKRRGFLEFFSR